MKWRMIITAAALSMMLFMSACQDTPPSDESDVPEMPSKVSEIPVQPGRDPFIVRDKLYRLEQGNAVYPVLTTSITSNTHSTLSLVNEKIEKTVLEFSEQEISSIDYVVYYNDNGVFSMSLRVYYPDEEVPYVRTFTFDCDTGELITIDRLFDSENNTWRRALPELIGQSGMPFFSALPPIDNDRMFYLTDTNLVIVYQLYEITTYSGGTPRFYVGYERLQDYIGKDSILKRIMNAD